MDSGHLRSFPHNVRSSVLPRCPETILSDTCRSCIRAGFCSRACMATRELVVVQRRPNYHRCSQNLRWPGIRMILCSICEWMWECVCVYIWYKLVVGEDFRKFIISWCNRIIRNMQSYKQCIGQSIAWTMPALRKEQKVRNNWNLSICLAFIRIESLYAEPLVCISWLNWNYKIKAASYRIASKCTCIHSKMPKINH